MEFAQLFLKDRKILELPRGWGDIFVPEISRRYRESQNIDGYVNKSYFVIYSGILSYFTINEKMKCMKQKKAVNFGFNSVC